MAHLEKTGRGENRDGGSAAHPLSIAEIVKRDNIPASKRMPAQTVARLSTRRILLGGATEKDIQKALTSRKKGDASSLEFPASVTVGLPGNSGKRVTAKELGSVGGAEGHGKSFQPEWTSLVYHPKLAARTQPRLLRRINGRQVVPCNQSFIYGGDDRAVYYPSGYPWNCIGKVDVFADAEGEYPVASGSGVLIGDRIVLTAGHVPPENTQSWKMRFTAGLYNGSPVDGPGAISYVSDFNGYRGGVSGKDYAVLRLYEAVGRDLGYFGWKTYDDSWNGGDYWWLAGYPFDIVGGQSPSYQSGIPVLDDDSDSGGVELEHHGDVASGDSGGPFWGFWDDGPHVVGTCSGHESVGGPSWTGGEDNNISAGGSALSNLLHWARANWPL